MEQQGECESLFTRYGQRDSFQQSPYTELTKIRPGWSKYLVLAGLATTIGSSLPVGYNIGVVNTPEQVIKQSCHEHILEQYHTNLSEGQINFLWSCIVSIYLVGGALGSLTGSYLADKVGRKLALIGSSALGGLAGLLFFLSATMPVELLLIGRFLVGISSGLITSIMPMYLMELSPPRLKGATGVLCPLGVTCGVLLGQIFSIKSLLGNENHWPLLLALYTLPLLLGAGLLIILPESPKYLFVIKRQTTLALKQLAKVRDLEQSQLQDEIQELKVEQQDNDANKESTWSIASVLRNRSLLLPLSLVCALQAGQQFSGINAVFYYSANIFQKAGLSKSTSELATIGAGCCNLLMAIISIPVMSHFNRRSVIHVSLASTAIFLVILGLATSLITKFSWMPYISIIGVLGFVICYGIGLGPIPYFIGSELFEVGPRPSAMALGSMSNWGGNFFIGLCFPLMQASIGAASFFIFALIVVLLFSFTWFYLPETRQSNFKSALPATVQSSNNEGSIKV